ncbi:MAG: hypothetical protein AB7K09_17665 [Planctomycetota bacterium]
MSMGLPAGRPQRGGAAFFAFVFLVLCGAVVGGYYFYILPGQQRAASNDDADANANAGKSNRNANKAPANNNVSVEPPANHTPEPPANNDNVTPPANNDPPVQPDPPAPTNDDEKALPIIKAAESKAGSKLWKEAVREIAKVAKMTLSDELATRAARVRSLATVMEDFEKVKSVRGDLAKDEPVPVKIFTKAGYQVIGSMYQPALQDIMSASGAGKLTAMWQTFETTVSAQELKGEFMVMRKIGGYESVPFGEVVKVMPWKDDERDEFYDSRVDKLRKVFDSSEKTPVDKYLLACGLKRYAPARGEHPWATEAGQLVSEAINADPFLAESADLERSRDYQQYLRMVQNGDSKDAEEQLVSLLDRYPNAAQLADARAAGSAKQAAQAMAEAVQREAKRGGGQVEQVDIEARGDLKEALNASGDALITQAKKFIAEAKRCDDLAMPDRPNFKENLEKAVYLYHAARKILEKARDKGVQPQVVDDLLREQVNQPLFWCKKRMPLF